MKFWWVNQNRTFNQEFNGGYMWSPKRKRNGYYNQFYENMTLVKPGDIVFSFVDTYIQTIGRIIRPGYHAIIPDEIKEVTSAWADDGWKVDVDYKELLNKIRPKDFIDELRSTLPQKYSPLQESGRGIESVYLAELPDAMAKVIIRHIGEEAKIIGYFADESLDEDEKATLEEEEIQSAVIIDRDLTESEKEAIVKARRGQGQFRRDLEQLEHGCRVSGITNRDHLIASHIKPWKKCDRYNERLDPNNGLLLSPNVDHLFDRGLISFHDNGDLLLSSIADKETCRRLGVPVDELFNVGRFSSGQKVYLEYHRNYIFKR